MVKVGRKSQQRDADKYFDTDGVNIVGTGSSTDTN
jgi:hypothetical protein